MSVDWMALAKACSAGSKASRFSFLQVLAALGAGGVEGYWADLRRATKIYYPRDGASVEIPAFRRDVPIAPSFDAVGVAGRRVVCFGRTGETHV